MSGYRRSPAFFFARGLLGVGIVFGGWALVAVIGSRLTDDAITRVVDIERDRNPRVPRPRGAEELAGISVRWTDDVRVTIDDPDWWLRVLDAAPSVLVSLAVILTSWQLLVVVVDIQRGVPFGDRAARRLRLSALFIAFAAFGQPVLAAWAETAVLEAAGRNPGAFLVLAVSRLVAGAAPMAALLAAGLLASVAYAFGEGKRLTEETEGLV